METTAQSQFAAFLRSVSSGDLEVVQKLLVADPSLLRQREKAGEGWAAIHHAAEAGQLDVASFLIEAGCSPDLPSGEDDGEGNFESGVKPLAVAAWKDQLALAKLLLKLGADPTGPDAFDHSAVHVAARFNHVSVLNLLLDHGADPNLFSYRRHFDEELDWHFCGSPLHTAAMNNSIEATRVLLAHGARRDESWVDQRTPLFYAAASGSAGVARVLLEAGADPNAREDRAGYIRVDYTPLHYAAYNGHLDAVKILLEFGSDATLLESNQKKSACQLAQAQGHKGVVALFESL